MSKQCCCSSDEGNREFVQHQQCRKITPSGNQQDASCWNDEGNKGCSKNCRWEKISTPCCEMIKSKKCIQYDFNDKEKNEKLSNKCVPCRKIVVSSNRMVYCDEEEEKETKGCCKGSSNNTCIPCCEIVTTKKRINYNLAEEDIETKSNENPTEKCIPCLKHTNNVNRTVYCDGGECLGNGCTPCCEVTASKQRIDYTSKTIDQGTKEKGKCTKKCVPCYEITCYCERIIYCDKESGNRNWCGENCNPCCEDVICKKRITYSPSDEGFGGMNYSGEALACC